MRFFALAALLVTALPAFAAEPVVVTEPKSRDMSSDRLKVDLSDCGDKHADVEAAIRGAYEKVGSCLSGFNPKLAAKIKAEFHKFKFVCDQETRAHGGTTTHDVENGKLVSAEIKLTMRSRLVQYGRQARLFHEMIHAVDLPARDQSALTGRDGKLIVSAQRHASAGFPDPVYGCQFACYPQGIGEDEGKAVKRWSQALAADGLELESNPKKQVELGEDAGPYAQLYAPTYAKLCESGKPVVSETLLEADRAANRPTCIAEKLANACSEPKCPAKKGDSLCSLGCELSDDTAGGRGLSGKMADRLMKLGTALSAAIPKSGKGLEGEEAEFYADANAAGIIKACR